jgi:uncharacterized cupin superfamily protein
MKRYRLKDLDREGQDHILNGIIPGKYLSKAGLGIKAGGHRSHDVGCDCPSCDGQGRHIHTDDSEVFIILQGKAEIEINGSRTSLGAGDVVVCEAGEDHHLIADQDDPCINLYLHAGEQPHPKQNRG